MGWLESMWGSSASTSNHPPEQNNEILAVEKIGDESYVEAEHENDDEQCASTCSSGDDSDSNLLLSLSASSMPAQRRKPRSRVVPVYDENRIVCDHPNCRNNPSASKPYDRDCTPQHNNMPPNGATKILLHSCCAPCSGAMFEEMLSKGLDVTIFFYNPNIHPRKEYEIRKEENKKYALKNKVPFVDCDYDSKSWYERTQGMEYDPERGARCTACFDMRMEVTAAYAAEHGFEAFTTTNATSRWKDVDQVNGSGIRAERDLVVPPGQIKPVYWVYNWQTDAMTLRKYQVSAEERFYKQEYCGCSYSLRDSNIWRQKEGIPKIKIGGEEAGLGTRYFEDPETDAAEESQEVVDSFFRDAAESFGNEKLKELTELKMAERKKVAGIDNVALNNW